MKSGKIRRCIGIVLLGFLISLGFLNPVQKYISIPNTFTLFEGQHQVMNASVPVYANNETVATVNAGDHFLVKANHSGEAEVSLTAGQFPIKEVDVKVLPDFRIVPGGQSVGVKLNTVGVLVVGHHLIETEKGKKSPGEIAGIEVGDIITTMNGTKVEEMNDIAPIVKKAAENDQGIKVKLQRDKKTIQKKLQPLKDLDSGSYKIGLYIRDSAAGIGTLTFYHPESQKYGALGHVISDTDTKKPIIVNDGKIIHSDVTSIQKGDRGNPGQKLSQLANEDAIMGTVSENTPFGIYGKLTSEIRNGITDKGIPIALSEQVKEGPAKIYTVIEGQKVKAFDVKIVSSIPQKFPATKGLIIKITDPELLKATGGIVQGMSGSPIIQDGKLIGAVTHVFVNDPTSGYGVHIEWMLDEAGINIYQEKRSKQRMAS